MVWKSVLIAASASFLVAAMPNPALGSSEQQKSGSSSPAAACCSPATPVKQKINVQEKTPVLAQTDDVANCAVRASLVMLQFTERVTDVERSHAIDALSAMKGVIRAEPSATAGLINVLVNADGTDMSKRVVDYLALAGYAVKNLGPEALEAEIAAQPGWMVQRKSRPSPKSAAVSNPTPAGNTGRVNDICPVTKTALESEAIRVNYHGFSVGLCCAGCKGDFTRMAERDKDAFIAKFVKPVDFGCALTGCDDGPDPARVTHDGRLIKLCCQSCLAQWGKADNDKRNKWAASALVPAAADDSAKQALTAPRSGASADEPPAGSSNAAEARSTPATPVLQKVPARRSEDPEPLKAQHMITLDGSLTHLIDAFNADKGKLRLVTLLSPT